MISVKNNWYNQWIIHSIILNYCSINVMIIGHWWMQWKSIWIHRNRSNSPKNSFDFSSTFIRQVRRRSIGFVRWSTHISHRSFSPNGINSRSSNGSFRTVWQHSINFKAWIQSKSRTQFTKNRPTISTHFNGFISNNNNKKKETREREERSFSWHRQVTYG